MTEPASLPASPQFCPDGRWDDFQVIMWGSTPFPSMAEPDRQVSAEEAGRYTQALRNNGCTAVLAYRQVPNCSWWKPHRWKLYAENINHAKAYPIGWHTNWEGFQRYRELAEKGDEKAYWRKPCFNDPAYREESRQRLQDLVRRRLRDAQPLCYSLGDEVSITLLTTPWDFCFCPHCMTAMRGWLGDQYGTLEALNAEWGTAFASWEDVRPYTTAQARRRKDRNFSSWNDHRAFMDRSFVGFLALNQEYIRELDPGALVGIGGTQHPSALGGYDLRLLSTRLSYLDVYDGGGAVEAYRSFRPPEMRFARTFASPTRGSLAEVWRLLLHGLDGAVKFLGGGFEDHEKPAETAADLREIQSGLYKLLKSCVRDDDPIAIHFSQASIRAGYIMQQRLPTEVDDEVATEADHGREAAFKILEDLGFQWRFVAPEQIERGELSRFRVLLMPGSWAVSDAEVEAITRFVKSGGTVIADGFPAWMDGRCRMRSRAGLEEVFGVRRESFQPAPWTVGNQVRPVYGRWNAFYSYYWSTCYPRADERLAVALPDGPMRLPVMELGVRPTTARAEAEVEVPNTKAAEPRAGLVFRNRCGQGQGLLLNFRLLDYLDWRKARNGPGEYVSRDPAMARSCLRLFRRLLESAGLRPRAAVRVEGDDLTPGYERVYFRGEGNAYVALLRDGQAATEGALDLEAFEAGRAAQVSALPRGPITLALPGGGGHVYDVRQHAYLGRTGELTFVPHAFQPSVFQVSPYRLASVSLSAPASAERDRPVRIEVTVAAEGGVPGTHVVNVSVSGPDGQVLPPFRGANVATVRGKGSGEIVFWDTDPQGVYTLTATEIASGLTSRCAIALGDGP